MSTSVPYSVDGMAASASASLAHMSTAHESSISDDVTARARSHAWGILAKRLYDEAIKCGLMRTSDVNDRYPSSNFSRPYAASPLNIVALRVARHQYATWPRGHPEHVSLLSGIGSLNVGAAMTVRSTVSEGLLDLIASDAKEVILGNSSRIQVLDTPLDLAYARKAQGAAIIRSINAVVVWSDEAVELLRDAQYIDDALLKFFWSVIDASREREGDSPEAQFCLAQDGVNNDIAPCESPYSVQSSGSDLGNSHFSSPSISASTSASSTWGNSNGKLVLRSVNCLPDQRTLGHFNREKYQNLEEVDDEHYRPVSLIAPIHHGLSFILAAVLSTLVVRQALHLCLLDGQWLRMLVALTIPVVFGLTMFMADSVVGVVLMLFGPVRQLNENSRYYSGKKPVPLQRSNGHSLPRITIQMPVYKESLEGVLKPSFESIKKAIKTYELQGGSANILVSEDGMTLIDEDERRARLAYYEENNITWIGRPKHGDQGFVREGRFKKASNLNFTYEVLHRVQAVMARKFPHAVVADQVVSDLLYPEEKLEYDSLYDTTLENVLKSLHPVACGAGRGAVGEFILMIDSDTRIPSDCFLDAASEMRQSPDVGILQHCSGVMLVSSSFFEKAIGYFTNMINFSITYSIANGDVAPFMGHNAYLRWSAMQEIARTTLRSDGTMESYKIWSDQHVSEDFVMALDMIDRGYCVRWATYANSGYEEGVSLTCTDEINRWQKYAWGVSEMVFNPWHIWWKRGPFTPLIRRFIFGPADLHYKFTSLGYCLSYYAIAVAVPSAVAMTLINGWIGLSLLQVCTPFQVWVSTMVVFLGAGTVSHVLVQFRAGFGGFTNLFVERIKFLPFMVFFFGGLPYHVLCALCAHVLNINMSWGATIKDWEASNIFAELPALFKRYWVLFIFWIVVLGGVIVCTTQAVPVEWRLAGVYDLSPLFTLAILHILYPFVLNPNLLRFSF